MMKQLTGTMSVRIFLIVVIGVLITASVVNLLRQRDFRENESRMQGQFIYERVENILRILEATDPEKRPAIQESLSHMGSRVMLNARPPHHGAKLPPELKALKKQLVPDIADQISLISAKQCGRQRHLRHQTSDHGLMPPHFEPPPEIKHEKCLAIYTHLEDNTSVRIHLRYGRKPPPLAREAQQPYLWLLMLTGLLLITWRIATLATRPLRELSNAARQLAKNIDHPPLAENRGPIEVRQAATAFNEMQRSIVKHVQERAFILGAIAHDLQTPLTRLRLRLEKIKEPDLKQKLIDDLNATQEMVREGLDFARLCGEHIQKNKIDLKALAEAICADFAEQGHVIQAQLPDTPIYIMGSAHLLKRCLTNLLNNAIAYAHDPALSLALNNQHIQCIISDQGGGIPLEEIDNILEPFRRLEDSRSRHTGGTGLGLSIARMIVEKHGGKIQLSNKTAPDSGLMVHITLPIR